jgi:cytochrome c-type biogenesis protein CcmE
MTVSPAPPPRRVPTRRNRWILVAGIAAILAVVAYLAFSSVSSALVYYRTPSELTAMDDPEGQTVRLGGLVKAGSISGPATDLTFVLTDGETEVTVRSAAAPTSSFRDGVGAVVEGALRGDGVFQATSVLVKHDENYEAPPPGAVPSDRVFEPGD